MNAKKILIVCFANICRSPAAEAIFKQMAAELGLPHRLIAESAGTSSTRSGEGADRTAAKVALKHGYDLSRHSARSVSRSLAERFDYIVSVDTYNLLELREILPEQEHPKLSLLLDHSADYQGQDVPDPYKKSKATHERTIALLENGVEGFINHLRVTHNI